MKILSVNVQSFGKLKNVNVNLSGGVNVLQNVNGFGKTTMSNFIRAMLYGFTYSRSKGVTDASHFAPWGSADKFGGSMIVEYDGEIYRIERFFGATARQETLSITNEKTHRPINLNVQPGEWLLGLTADSYDRSAYFPQEAVELSSNDNFDSRLANLVQNGAEDYDKVQEKLRSYKKKLRFERGMGGVIYELDCKKQTLLQQLNNSQQAERRSVEIDRRLQQIAVDKHTLETRQAEYQSQLDALNRQSAQSQLTDEDRRVNRRLAELEEKLSRIPAEFETDFATCDQLTKDIAEIKDVAQREKPRKAKKSNKSIVWTAIVAIIIGIALVALGATQIIPIVAGLATGAVIALLGVAVLIVFSRKKSPQPQSSKREDLIAKYLEFARKYVYTDGIDYETVKRNLWDMHAGYQGDLREKNTLLSLVKKPQTDAMELNQKISGTSVVLNEISQQIHSLAVELGKLTEERKQLVFDSVSIQDQILTVDAEKNDAEHRYEVANMVVSALEQAKENLSSSYLPRLCARCTELLGELTQSNLEVTVDRTFGVKIRENGQTKGMSEFSRGIREITLLCFRIALSELLYDGKIPFVIIDDAFVNFDEYNFVRATDLLKKVAEYGQVIYFTCHNRTGSLLK